MPITPEEKAANDVYRALGRESRAQLLSQHCPALVLEGRRLEFSDSGIYYGRNGSVHPYGKLALQETEEATKFLRSQHLPPKAIVDDVEEIIRELTHADVRLAYITVDWSKGVDKPIVRQLMQPKRDVRFGLFSSRSINAFEDDSDQGLTNVAGAARYLRGLWYND